MYCSGKSIMEHNEILGMDAALKFINQEHCQLIRNFLQVNQSIIQFKVYSKLNMYGIS